MLIIRVQWVLSTYSDNEMIAQYFLVYRAASPEKKSPQKSL